MPVVAEEYAFVIGVDTHAATHSLALITAATGAVVIRRCSQRPPVGWTGQRRGSRTESVTTQHLWSSKVLAPTERAEPNVLVMRVCWSPNLQ